MKLRRCDNDFILICTYFGTMFMGARPGDEMQIVSMFVVAVGLAAGSNAALAASTMYELESESIIDTPGPAVGALLPNVFLFFSNPVEENTGPNFSQIELINFHLASATRSAPVFVTASGLTERHDATQATD